MVKHSNNSSAICRRIFWVCLTILWSWRLKGQALLIYFLRNNSSVLSTLNMFFMRILRILYLLETDVKHLQICMLNSTRLVKTADFMERRNLFKLQDWSLIHLIRQSQKQLLWGVPENNYSHISVIWKKVLKCQQISREISVKEFILVKLLAQNNNLFSHFLTILSVQKNMYIS